MLEVNKIPSLAISKVVLRNDITTPMNKGSVYLFVTPDEKSMYTKINKYTSRTTKFNILSLRAAYHPNNDYFFLNSANKIRFVNYRKTFTQNMNQYCPRIPMVRSFTEQLKGMNFVYCVPYFFEVAKGYAKENKPELLFKALLEKFRTEVGIPTVFPTNDKKPDIVDKGEYSARYIIFDIDDFSLPVMSEINVSRAAKHPDILRNFLYFLENESSKYLHLLTGIYFLFIAPKGVIKLKLDDEYNIVEEFTPTYNDSAMFFKDGERVMYNIHEAPAPGAAKKDPAVVLSSSVRTLVLLMHKIKNNGQELTNVENEETSKAVVVSDSEEKNKADEEAVEKMRQLDAVIDTLPEEAVEVLSDELVQIDNDNASVDKHEQQVNAILDNVNKARQEKVKVMSPKARGAMNKMNSIEVQVNKTSTKKIEDLLTEPANLTIPTVSLPIESHTGYETNSFHEFTNAYNDQVKNRDIVHAASHFRDAEIPLYVDKIDIVDNSDAFNEIETVSTRFRDEDGNTFTVTVDLPKMYKGNRIKINSSEKVLIGQLTYLPILKIDDSVIITTNYNKVFMEKKYGNGLTPQANKLLRALTKMHENKDASHDIFFGDYSTANASSKILSEEMKELSGVMLAIGIDPSVVREPDFKDKVTKGSYEGSFFVSFNDSDIQALHKALAPEDIGDHTIIGFMGNIDSPVLLDMESSRISVPSMGIQDETIYSVILKISDERNLGIRPYYDDVKTINKLTSTYVKIMNNWIPLIYILIYTDGLYSIMEKLGTQYEIVPAEEKMRRANKEKEIKVELQDCTLYIDIEDVASSILFYPLQDADLTMYSLADLEKPENTGSVLVENTNGDINFPLYINTFKSCFIDPYTKGILEHLDQPTDFVGVFLYANNLLASPTNMEELSLNSCRIRYAEIVQAVYYKELANAYAEYSAKKKRGSKSAKMSIPRDKVCTQVMALPNVEEYSNINPYQESVKRYSCNYKGHLGKNVSRAYTWKARAYHPTYIGSIGLPTAFSANIGINKQLTIDPKVDNLRGMFNVVEDPNTLSSKNLITSTEAITVGSATHSDAPRNAMNQAQKSHIIPIEDMSTGYVTNSYDRMMAYTSDDFVERASQEGTVEKITDNYIVVKYKDGTTDAIKLKRLRKNSAKGKFVVSYMKPAVRAGQKIKPNDILAHDKGFFKYNDLEGLVGTMGTMLNILWKPEACVYEDSVVISESTSKKLVNIAIKRVAAKFHKNTKVLEYVKLGEFVNADTELITYVEGTEDDMMAEFLDRAEMTDLDKKVRTAHKAGTIFNIRVAHACEKSTMSSSVSKMIADITKQVISINEEDTLQKSHNKFNKRENTEMPQEVKSGHKMNGEIIDKDYVLVEFFIEYPDFAGLGDKGSQFTALKGITAKVVPDDEMPIGVDSGRKVDMICSPYSPGARKTFDVNHVFIQNCLMEKLTNDARELFLGKK